MQLSYGHGSRAQMGRISRGSLCARGGGAGAAQACVRAVVTKFPRRLIISTLTWSDGGPGTGLGDPCTLPKCATRGARGAAVHTPIPHTPHCEGFIYRIYDGGHPRVPVLKKRVFSHTRAALHHCTGPRAHTPPHDSPWVWAPWGEVGRRDTRRKPISSSASSVGEWGGGGHTARGA